MAKFVTNVSGAIWWPYLQLMQVTESISGSVVPLAMFFTCFALNNLFYPILLRMLGFPNGTFTKESFFGNVSQDFVMDNVRCNGSEKDIRCSKSFKNMSFHKPL